MFVIIVMLIVFLTVTISCWWLDDFDAAGSEERLRLESQSTDAPYETATALQTHSTIGD